MKRIFMTLVAMFLISHSFGEITWGAPTTLSTASINASDPKIVVDPSGNTTAVWIENGVIIANNLPLNGSWGMAASISGSSSSKPQLGVDGSGNVTAVWLESGVVKTATFSGGSWSAASALSGSGASNPSLAIDSTGDISVIWVRGGFIEGQIKPAGGSYTLTSVLSTANSDNPHVSIGSNGNILAVWHSSNSGQDLVFSSTATASNGVWGAAKSISPVGLAALSLNYPKGSVDSHGNGYAICYRYTLQSGNYLNVSVLASTLSASSGNWSPIPSLLSQGGTTNPADLSSKILADADGNAIALWSSSFDNSSFSIQSASQSAGGTWTSSTDVYGLNLYAFQADMAVNSLGSLVSAAMYFDGSTISISSFESDISGPFLGVWSTPATISSGSNNGFPKIHTSYTAGLNQINGAAIWIEEIAGTITVQATVGSLATLDPPTNVTASQALTDFGVYQDYTNTLTWTASTSPNLFGYSIFRNGIHLTDIGANQTLELIEHNQLPATGSITYGVVAIDNFGTESPVATTTL